MNYIFFRNGVVAVQATPEAFAAIQIVSRQIADDVANFWGNIDDANALLDVVKNSLAGNGLGTAKVLGAVAFAGLAAAPIAAFLGVSAGATVVAVAGGWAAGKLYEWAFDSATEIGKRAGESAFDMWGSQVDPTTNTDFYNGTRSRPVPRDPLAIDLDGDGIETVGIVQGSPVLFDHDADGTRTGTGWLQGDDAWLVLDRNGNGSIDTGRELFGVDTLISGTPGVNAVYARNGFEALSTLDANGDRVFNASDAAFTQVRLWRDLNQDGISQAGELSTLSSQNITAIGLTPSTTVTNLGNGNRISGTATVTRSNGTTTTAAGVGVNTTAANLDLANNPFYREFTTPVTLTTLAQDLPQMQGSGMVMNHIDLKEGLPTYRWSTELKRQFLEYQMN